MADEAPKPGEHPLLAGVEGVVRGVVPFGMGDAIVQGYLGETPEQQDAILQGQRQRKEVNPGAAIAGEFGGNLAGLLIPGSQAKVVGAVEGFASKAVGGGLAGKLAAGAAGGGLYGLGSAINEDTLGEPSTAAEKLAIISGSGLIGAGVNAITHGAFKASESALTKVAGSSSLREWLDSLANKLYEKQMASASVENANNLTREEVHSIFQNNKGLFSPLDTHASVAKKAAQAREWAGQEMGAALKEGQGNWFNPDRFEVRVEKNLTDKLRNDPHATEDVKRIEKLIEGYKNRAHTFEDIHEIQSNIQSRIGQAEVPASKKILSEFRTELVDELIDQLHDVAPNASRQYADARNSFRQLSALREMADTMAKRSGRNSSLAMRDMFFGGVLGRLGVIAGLAGAAVSHEVRERGGYVMAAASRKMAESFPGIAGSFKGKIDAMLESGLGGAYRNTLAELSAKGADALLGGHVVLAQTDPNYLPALGLEHETPEAAQQYAGKAAGLSFLQEQLNGLNSELDNQADRFAGKAQGRPPSMPISPKMSEKDFAETYARLQHIATVPQVVDTSKMAGVAPATAALYQQQLVKAAQFLLDKAPKDPNAGLLPAFQKPWKPSPSDLATWTKYAEGVTQPLKVVTAVSNGKLPAPEAVEALKTVYPKTFEDLRNRMMERVASLKDPMSYGKKQALAALLGREVLGEDPRVATFIQTTHAAARGPGGGGNMPKTDGRQRVSQAENMATQAQRIQTRGAQ